MTGKIEQRLLGIAGTAKYLGLSKETIYRFAGNQVPAFKPKGSGNRAQR